jgi:hypothetical protein
MSLKYNTYLPKWRVWGEAGEGVMALCRRNRDSSEPAISAYGAIEIASRLAPVAAAFTAFGELALAPP